MNTLNLDLKKNILYSFKYKQSEYDWSRSVQKRMISFAARDLDSITIDRRMSLRQKNDNNALTNGTKKIKYCVSASKNEYNTGKSPSNVSFGGLSSSRLFRTILEKSALNGALCSATAMLLACCVLRPISIMFSENVEKENRMIAATKSIASGIIGFIMMFAVSKPIAKAVAKINKNPEKYLDKNAMQKLLDGNAKNVETSRVYNIATRFFKSGADILTAAPKGSMTIILIPPLLNIIFKKERKKKKDLNLPPTNILMQKTPHIDDVENFVEQKHYVFFKGSQKQSNNISFKGNYAKMYDSFTEKLAVMFGKILSCETVQKTAEKLKNTSVESHVMALSGTIVSAFYVINTKVSKKIEESRKEPLIYNSIISWALANAGAYSIDGFLNKYIKKFEKHYAKVNAGNPNLNTQLRGITVLKSALIFGTMYRWVTPWISTILAEKVWNKKLQKKSEQTTNA